MSSFIFTVYSASERVRFGHRPESYGFLPWCLVPDQNQVLFFFFLRRVFCFPGFEYISYVIGFCFQVSVDRDGLDCIEERVLLLKSRLT